MREWILGILFVVILGIIMEILLENARLAKFSRGIFGVFTLFIIVSPIPKLIDGGFNFNLPFFPNGEIVLDQSYLDAISQKKLATLQNAAQSYFEQNDIKAALVTLSGDYYGDVPNITRAEVNLKNAVIGKAHEHINKYELAQSLLAECLNIEKSIITVVY